jgi:hypothetical protein
VAASLITDFEILNMFTAKKDIHYFYKIGCQRDEMSKRKHEPLKVNVSTFLGDVRPERDNSSF